MVARLPLLSEIADEDLLRQISAARGLALDEVRAVQAAGGR